MIYVLDTDICIFALKGQFPSIRKHMAAHPPHGIKVPSVVKAELLLGVHKSANPRQAHTIVEFFLAPLEIIPFDDSCAVVYAKIRHDLEKKGRLIGPNDLIIAATTLAHQGSLITHNTKEFSRVSGLKLQDWTQ